MIEFATIVYVVGLVIAFVLFVGWGPRNPLLNSFGCAIIWPFILAFVAVMVFLSWLGIMK